MQEFQKEQKKSLTLRWVVIALAGFAVLLCLANIGTSFAAATLAKDVSTQPDTAILIDKSTGQILSADHVDELFDLEMFDGTASLPENTTAEEFVSDGGDRSLADATLGGTNTKLQISQQKVNRLMQKLCRNWPGVGKYSCRDDHVCRYGTGAVEIIAWYVHF